MVEPVTIDLRHLAHAVGIPLRQVQAVVELLDEGNTIPFITRYRKDQTGGLDEEQIRQIQAQLTKMRLLAERKQTILRSLESQGKLTPELEKQIRSASSPKRLEDIYLPYKPKKRTLATQARECGLEPLADEILAAAPNCSDLDNRAKDFVNPDKGVKTVADALLGAGYIIAERFSERADIRQRLREILQRTGKIVCSELVEQAAADSNVVEITEEQTAGADSQAGSASAADGKAASQPQGQAAGPTEASSEEQTTTRATTGREQRENEQQSSEHAGNSASDGKPEVLSPPGSSTSGGAISDTSAADVDKSKKEEPTEQAAGPQLAGEPPREKQDQSSPEKPDSPVEQAGADSGASDRQVTADQTAESAEMQQEGEQPPQIVNGTSTPLQITDQRGPQPVQIPGPPQAKALCRVETGQETQSEPAADSSAEVAQSNTAQQPSTQEPLEGQPSGNGKATQADSQKKRLTKKELRELRKKKAKERKRREFRDFFNYSEEVRKIPPHRILAINRGERARVLKVRLEYDIEQMRQVIEQMCVPEGHPHADFLRGCAKDALSRLVLPSLEREVRRELTEKAEAHAVKVFARNLRKLLLQPPVRDKRVLAIDPGLRSGCRVAALDQFGNVLDHGTFYVIGSRRRREEGKKLLCSLVKRYGLSVIAIGNGTGCRQTEEFVADLLANELKDSEVSYVIVNEAGASVYSTSRIGREEFPYYDASIRGAISIGRRLQDPLSELVKIHPANIGVGLYQHDVKAKHLRASLDEVVESCVNYVGVDVNTASPALLRYVSGLNQLTARRVYEYRLQHGPFRNRRQLLDVPGIGETTFIQAAGFLKIANGENPLDSTWIHPESYHIAEKVLEKLGFSPEDLRRKESLEEIREKVQQVNVAELAQELQTGELTLRDILTQLCRPGRDPREDLPGPIFRRGIMKMDDLEPGMELMGTVLNVVDFGAFVDIGLHQTGLVHVSQLSTKYVRDPHEVVSVGDIVRVWVLGVDKKRRRVSLTMISPEEAARQEEAKKEAATQKRKAKAEARPAKAEPKGKQPRSAKPRRKQPPKQRRRPAPPVPETLPESVLEGKEPMRSFADLAAYFRLKQQQQRQQENAAVAQQTQEQEPETKSADQSAASDEATAEAAVGQDSVPETATADSAARDDSQQAMQQSGQADEVLTSQSSQSESQQDDRSDRTDKGTDDTPPDGSAAAQGSEDHRDGTCEEPASNETSSQASTPEERQEQ